MLLLSIDPGITTGVALLNEDGSVVHSYELSGKAPTIVARLLQETCQDAVIEAGPPSRQNPYMDDLDGRLRAAFPDATWMFPGEWKGTPRAQLPVNAPSRHARDAVRMGREYLHKTRERKFAAQASRRSPEAQA